MENSEVEEIKRMLRHLHNDVENVKRKQEVLELKNMHLAFLIQIGTGAEISDIDIDHAINLEPDNYSSLDETYSPIDETDKVAWEQHLLKEKRLDKESMEENKRIEDEVNKEKL